MGTVQQQFFDKRARVLSQKHKEISPVTEKKPITEMEIKALNSLKLHEPILTAEQLQVLHLMPKWDE